MLLRSLSFENDDDVPGLSLGDRGIEAGDELPSLAPVSIQLGLEFLRIDLPAEETARLIFERFVFPLFHVVALQSSTCLKENLAQPDRMLYREAPAFSALFPHFTING
jgi:hypothetical protein